MVVFFSDVGGTGGLRIRKSVVGVFQSRVNDIQTTSSTFSLLSGGIPRYLNRRQAVIHYASYAVTGCGGHEQRNDMMQAGPGRKHKHQGNANGIESTKAGSSRTPQTGESMG